MSQLNKMIFPKLLLLVGSLVAVNSTASADWWGGRHEDRQRGYYRYELPRRNVDYRWRSPERYTYRDTHVGQMDTDGRLSPGEIRNPRIDYYRRYRTHDRHDNCRRSGGNRWDRRW